MVRSSGGKDSRNLQVFQSGIRSTSLCLCTHSPICSLMEDPNCSHSPRRAPFPRHTDWGFGRPIKGSSHRCEWVIAATVS